MRQREIPSTNEMLPVVGLGTWLQFDVSDGSPELTHLTEVLQVMHMQGGKMIDSSPMYGRSEKVVGDLTSALEEANSFFYATKVWTTGKQAGIEQMQSSMEKMQRSQIDLMQIHNLLDWETHLKTLKDWKEKELIRYIGITHYTDSYHDDLEDVIKREDAIDFVQFNYSILNRHAEKRLLKAAMDHNVAVIINVPFQGGKLFKKTKGIAIPDWAGEADINTWGQFFLKYILAHPAVTCVIPGTSKPKHLIDNMQAGYGRLPDEAMQKRMIDFMDKL